MLALTGKEFSMRLHTVTALAFASCGAMLAQQPGDPTPLKVGDAAPNFTLGSTMGGKVTLADFKGKSPVVVAFFPAAFTGG
jgi:thioredoxin-dependent peroxiredoxin